MNNENELLRQDILSYLEQHEKKDMLRFLTCGSVDDGKSTLIGRILYETDSLKSDQLEHIKVKSELRGFDYLDLSLATDGLLTEREQGITIDVLSLIHI